MSGQTPETTPKKTSLALKTAIIIIAVIIVGVAIIVLTQPHFELTEISVMNALPSCSWWTSSQTVGAYFTLVNSGLVGGYATVHVTGVQADGVHWDLGTQQYYVPAGSSVRESITRYVDCSRDYYVVVYIINVKGPFG